MESPPFPENIYGHLQRVRWLRDHLRSDDRVLDFGCGTGYFITLPLLEWGYDVLGVDLDQASIDHGRSLVEAAGHDPSRLSAADLREIDGLFDAVIASEVFEHMNDEELGEVLALLRSKLVPGGRLLVTVPNGYGWYEFESFLWNRGGVGSLYERVRHSNLHERVKRAKRRAGVATQPSDIYELMTLAPTPHVQRFTWRSLRKCLEHSGFSVIDQRGAVAVCGPLSDMLLSGFDGLQRANQWAGERLSPIAADFYAAALREP
jgi:2-polyprenyl-3-methyl-5-hydroxy-6-metoxy-1,4-benzoquinol methylase